MDLLDRLQFFTATDAAALVFIGVAWLGIGWIIEHPPARHPSVSVLMADYRREWMKQYITRDPRVFDALTLNGLREGTSFFASACLIAIGGGLALIGSSESLQTLAEDLSLDDAPALIWDVKVLLVLAFLVSALLKFIWANRLFGYNAVVMASVPNDESDAAYARAAQAAEINIHAVRNFNRGLRSVYFALAALAWLLGPVALILGTLVSVITLGRREFASHSRAVLLQGHSS